MNWGFDMKQWCVVLGVFFSMMASAQLLPEELSGEYLINAHLGDLQNERYAMERINPDGPFVYGIHLQIDSEMETYHSFYTAPCGVDCFRSTRGRYEVVDEQHIHVWRQEVAQTRFCPENFRTEMNEDLGIFRMESTDHGLMFIPVSDEGL